MSETLYRKYRPQIFSDVRSQEHVKTTLQNQLKAGTVSHAYLFSGPRGIGKTTIARILSRAVNCEKLKDGEPCGACNACVEILGGACMDVSEIDAASHTGVDNVRENIIESVRFAPAKMNRKVYIIDEVHMLSISAFNALLKTLEEPPAHALFILATTELHKVPETIISRCQRFDFHRIKAQEIVDRLKELAKNEKVEVDDDVLNVVARKSEGCLRDAESLFSQVLAIGEGKKIGMKEASLILPRTNIDTVIQYIEALSSKQIKQAIDLINNVVDDGVRIKPFEDELIEVLRFTLMLSLKGEPEEVNIDEGSVERLKKIAEQIGAGGVSKIIQLLLEYRQTYRNERIPQLPLELIAVEFCGAAAPVRASEPPTKAVLEPQTKQEEPPTPKEETSSSAQKKSLDESVATLETPETRETSATPAAEVKFSLNDLKNKWKQICDVVKTKSPTLPVLLQSSELVRIDGGTVILKSQYKFLSEQINEMRNRKVLEGVFSEAMNEAVLIRAEFSAPAGNDELVNDLINEFGGAVVE